MILNNDPDGFVGEATEQRICPFHQKNPDIANFPACSCSGGWRLRKATPEEREANRKRREDRQRRSWRNIL